MKSQKVMKTVEKECPKHPGILPRDGNKYYSASLSLFCDVLDIQFTVSYHWVVCVVEVSRGKNLLKMFDKSGLTFILRVS